jgi:hypothetical protein
MINTKQKDRGGEGRRSRSISAKLDVQVDAEVRGCYFFFFDGLGGGQLMCKKVPDQGRSGWWWGVRAGDWHSKGPPSAVLWGSAAV